MNETIKQSWMRLTLGTAMAVATLATSLASYGQGATATISSTPVSGGFNYTILLQNTGSTVLNSFWYGWTTSGNNLPSFPNTATNSLGWGNTLAGNSIEWINNTGTTLAPGASGIFGFFSTSSPTAMTTAPAGESVAYVHGITFSQGLAGDSTGIFSPLVVPEPSSLALVAAGATALVVGQPRLRQRALRRSRIRQG